MKINKWQVLGYVAAVFNPIPSGLIAGYCLYTEKKYGKTGRNVMITAIVWTALLLGISLLIGKG